MVIAQSRVIARGHENGHCTILGVIVQGLDNGHWTIMDDCPGDPGKITA